MPDPVFMTCFGIYLLYQGIRCWSGHQMKRIRKEGTPKQKEALRRADPSNILVETKYAAMYLAENIVGGVKEMAMAMREARDEDCKEKARKYLRRQEEEKVRRKTESAAEPAGAVQADDQKSPAAIVLMNSRKKSFGR